MNRQSFLRVVLVSAGVLCACTVSAQNKPADAPKITEDHRVAIIRGVEAEKAFAKVAFPQGKKGLTLKDGKISPGTMEVNSAVLREGAAANVGDRMLITDLRFDGSKIILEFNGGPRKGAKWYQRISVGSTGGDVPVAPSDPRSQNAQGSVLTIVFHDHIPDMTVEQLKQVLAPVLDFASLTVAEAYAKQLPPKVQEAIKNHQVLVGMDRDMVQYTLGRPPKRYRDKDDKGRDYEEWIYGTPPEDVQFVRFVGPTVAMLTVMKVNGEKVVKTEPEVELAVKDSEAKPAETAADAPQKRTKKPSLLAPGEQNPDARGTGSSDTSSGTPQPSPPNTTPGPQFASHAD